MKRTTSFEILVIFIILSFIIIFSNISYPFFKEILIKNKNKPDSMDISEKNIDEIEDQIFIPETKNYIQAILKKSLKNDLIEVVIPENILYFYKFNYKTGKYTLVKQYPVAVGKKSTSTPIGEGVIYTKGPIVFRYLYGTNAGKVITKAHTEEGQEFDMPYEKMFGLYMLINHHASFVIHSTTEDWKAGMAVSGGCVRMLIPDMLELYSYIDPAIKVIIKYEPFKLENDMLTVYPDIYKKYTSIYQGLMEFLNNNNINPVVFDPEKIKKELYNSLPLTISLNDLLRDYFISKNLKFDKIKIKYDDKKKNVRHPDKINEFFVFDK